MKKACFIVPYFGKLPKTFEYWLQCCKNNEKFNWIIITDDKTKYDYPSNVSVVYSSLGKIKEIIESKMKFEISLNRPYKLCDFRPCYGFIFSEYLTDYDLWGYCDLDMLFGDLGKFLNDALFEKYEKISYMGHMSLLKNCDEVNHCFMKCDYKAVLQNPKNRIFDEIRFSPNINELLINNGYSIFKLENVADVGLEKYNFELYGMGNGNRCTKISRAPVIFRYNKQKLFQLMVINGKLEVNEILYVHFQKRNIISHDLKTNFLLVPNEIIDDYEVTVDDVLRYSKGKTSYFVKHIYIRIRNAIKSRLVHK